jgi:hypothetical protein
MAKPNKRPAMEARRFFAERKSYAFPASLKSLAATPPYRQFISE